MNEETEKPVWYVRRSTIVQGPYSIDDIRRYLLLGRVRLSDRVSADGVCWEPLTQCPHLIPAEMQDLGTEEGRARFEAARRAVDERGTDREAANPVPGARLARRDWRRGALPAVGGIVALVFILVAVGYYRDFEDGVMRAADCTAAPGEGAVWSGCVKDGLDVANGATLAELRAINASFRGADLVAVGLPGARLDYADFTRADLARADLREAVLRGANLSGANLAGADLRGADLRNADLRNANLEGTRLEGAMLGNALWSDGRSCAADAVGGCDS